MVTMFDYFGDELGNLPVEPHLINNYKDIKEIELIRAEREKNLSPFAMRTENSRGRRIPEDPCEIRSPYERDLGRIIFSQSFRRLTDLPYSARSSLGSLPVSRIRVPTRPVLPSMMLLRNS